MSQLAIWNDDELAALRDTRPLPLIVASKWGFNLAYIDQDGNPDHYLYAGLDWFRGLGGERSRWSRVKKELVLSAQQLPYLASNGKTYQVDFVTDEGLYHIAIEMRVTQKRPQLEAIRVYLRRAGVFADQVRRDPARAAARLQGAASRNEFTAKLAQVVTDLTRGSFAVATNDIYQGLYKRTAEQLRRDLGSPHIRDAMSLPSLHITGLCEWLCAERIGQAPQLSFDEARDIIQDIAGMLGLQVEEIEQRMGIDIVTGRRLLGPVDAIRG